MYQQSLYCLRSFKVTHFCTNQKSACYFILHNTNLHPIQNTADYCENVCFQQRVPRLNVLTRGEPPNT